MTNAVLFEKEHHSCTMYYGTTASDSAKTEYVLSSTGLYIPKEKNIIETPQLIIPGHTTIILN